MMSKKYEQAILGGGCFWCTEAIFKKVKGVVEVIPGYSGGWIENPTYEEVCTDQTGHAEVVKITYDPEVISYRELLKIFFTIHDPTTKNRQGNDVGSQYRSIIIYFDDKQKKIAEEEIKEAEKIWQKKIVTELVPFKAFYKAEDYHINYFERNPTKPYCSLVIMPKIEKFEKLWKSYLK
jgi:peptide-methionine (S)-S-oxide reductase